MYQTINYIREFAKKKVSISSSAGDIETDNLNKLTVTFTMGMFQQSQMCKS